MCEVLGKVGVPWLALASPLHPHSTRNALPHLTYSPLLLPPLLSSPGVQAYELMVRAVGKEGVPWHSLPLSFACHPPPLTCCLLPTPTAFCPGVQAYERMVKAVGKEGVPWQLVNNIAALQHERGAYEEAVTAYKEALGPHGPWAPILHPEASNAAALHRLILSQYPSYLDCHLRLAVMALDRRDNATAMTHISAVLQRAPDSVDALLLRSRAEADRDDHAAAKDTLKRIVDLSPEKCTAALVALVSALLPWWRISELRPPEA
ncbi:unnamed protein product [Closterium sp. Yama58-4]|nr:unnamed protein product [Closterium sp. Yama58-4]